MFVVAAVVAMWLQSTLCGMVFALALIVAKKRKLLGGESQSGHSRVFVVWVAGLLSVACLIVRGYQYA